MERDLPKSMERDLPKSMESDLPKSMERDLPKSMERDLPKSMVPCSKYIGEHMFAGKCLWGSIHTSPRGDRRPRRVRPQNLYVRAENARRLNDFQDCFKSVFPLNRIHKSTNKGYVTPAGYGPPETCISARWWHLGV